MMNYKIWATSSGKEIPLEELTLSHLQNIIKYLEERDEEKFYNIMAIGSTFNGEMAQYYSSQAEPEENEWLPYLRQELTKIGELKKEIGGKTFNTSHLSVNRRDFYIPTATERDLYPLQKEIVTALAIKEIFGNTNILLGGFPMDKVVEDVKLRINQLEIEKTILKLNKAERELQEIMTPKEMREIKQENILSGLADLLR